MFFSILSFGNLIVVKSLKCKEVLRSRVFTQLQAMARSSDGAAGGFLSRFDKAAGMFFCRRKIGILKLGEEASWT